MKCSNQPASSDVPISYVCFTNPVGLSDSSNLVIFRLDGKLLRKSMNLLILSAWKHTPHAKTMGHVKTVHLPLSHSLSLPLHLHLPECQNPPQQYQEWAPKIVNIMAKEFTCVNLPIFDIVLWLKAKFGSANRVFGNCQLGDLSGSLDRSLSWFSDSSGDLGLPKDYPLWMHYCTQRLL